MEIFDKIYYEEYARGEKIYHPAPSILGYNKIKSIFCWEEILNKASFNLELMVNRPHMHLKSFDESELFIGGCDDIIFNEIYGRILNKIRCIRQKVFSGFLPSPEDKDIYEDVMDAIKPLTMNLAVRFCTNPNTKFVLHGLSVGVKNDLGVILFKHEFLVTKQIDGEAQESEIQKEKSKMVFKKRLYDYFFKPIEDVLINYISYFCENPIRSFAERIEIIEDIESLISYVKEEMK